VSVSDWPILLVAAVQNAGRLRAGAGWKVRPRWLKRGDSVCLIVE